MLSAIYVLALLFQKFSPISMLSASGSIIPAEVLAMSDNCRTPLLLQLVLAHLKIVMRPLSVRILIIQAYRRTTTVNRPGCPIF